MSECHDLAEKTLKDHKEIVIKIAEALLERETLTSEEIYAIAEIKQPVYNENGEAVNAEPSEAEEAPKKKRVKKEEKESNE